MQPERPDPVASGAERAQPVALESCETVRESISARLDGELAPLPVAVVSRHLRWCGGCANYEAAAAVVSRHLRVRSLPDVPDLRPAILGPLGLVPTGSGHPDASPRSSLETDLARRTTHFPARRGGAAAHGGNPPLRRAVRWVAAVIPFGLALTAAASGAAAHPRIVASHPVTPCIAALVHEHRAS